MVVSIKTVASEAGVSIGTVSNVLSGNCPVSDDVRNRVLKAIDDLDYHPNMIAHSLITGQTQCLALLSGVPAGEQHARTAQNLLHDSSLTRTTIYFNHYLFETYRLLEQPAAFFERMSLWFDLPAQGFRTTPEQPEPTRSDCHGWGAHPLYHYFASLLGIRSSSFGFDQVEIAPMPGHLTSLSGEMVHPIGRIVVDLHIKNGSLSGKVSLPETVSGIFRYSGRVIALTPGIQTVEL